MFYYYVSLITIGLFNYLQKRKDAGTLQELAGDDGEIHCVFICCDLPYQYLDDYFVKLGESYFHPIRNSVSIQSLNFTFKFPFVSYTLFQ